jgi:dihydrolipoamide dehydrogenase
MSEEITTDVAIIGAGPGGYTAAIRLAELGKKAVLIDQESVGGVCLHHGCIPTKALMQAVHTYKSLENSQHLGITGEVKIDFNVTQQWKDKIVKSLDDGVRFLLKKHDVNLVIGTAEFESGNTLLVKNQGQPDTKVIFQRCIIATGSKEKSIMGLEFKDNIMSSTQALRLTELPKSIIVIGGGYIGVEMSQILSKLGVKITLVEALPNILSLLDDDVADKVKDSMKRQGIDILTGAAAISIDQSSQIRVVVQHQGAEKVLEAEKLLIAVGRAPLTQGIGLEKAGVNIDPKGFIVTDDALLTSNQDIYAIGDVTGKFMLAHSAAAQGKAVAECILGKRSVMDKIVPYVIFGEPEVAGAGITEKEAKAKNIPYETKVMKSGSQGKFQIVNAKDSMIKLIYHDNRILGVQMLGPSSGDMIMEYVLAMQHGIGIDKIAETVHPHPTLVESIGEFAELLIGLPINTI